MSRAPGKIHIQTLSTNELISDQNVDENAKRKQILPCLKPCLLAVTKKKNKKKLVQMLQLQMKFEVALMDQ